MQPAGLVHFQGFELSKMETHCSVISQQFFTTSRGLMENLHEKQFYVFISTLTAKRINVQNFTITASVINSASTVRS